MLAAVAGDAAAQGHAAVGESPGCQSITYVLASIEMQSLRGWLGDGPALSIVNTVVVGDVSFAFNGFVRHAKEAMAPLSGREDKLEFIAEELLG